MLAENGQMRLRNRARAKWRGSGDRKRKRKSIRNENLVSVQFVVCPFYVNSLLFFFDSFIWFYCFLFTFAFAHMHRARDFPIVCLPAAKWIFVLFALHTQFKCIQLVMLCSVLFDDGVICMPCILYLSSFLVTQILYLPVLCMLHVAFLFYFCLQQFPLRFFLLKHFFIFKVRCTSSLFCIAFVFFWSLFVQCPFLRRKYVHHMLCMYGPTMPVQ